MTPGLFRPFFLVSVVSPVTGMPNYCSMTHGQIILSFWVLFIVQPPEAYKGSAVRGGQGTRGTLAAILAHRTWPSKIHSRMLPTSIHSYWDPIPILSCSPRQHCKSTIPPVLTLVAGVSLAHGTCPSGHLGMCTQGDPCAFLWVLWGHPLLGVGWVE